jgi:hypothetical protein
LRNANDIAANGDGIAIEAPVVVAAAGGNAAGTGRLRSAATACRQSVPPLNRPPGDVPTTSLSAMAEERQGKASR